MSLNVSVALAGLVLIFLGLSLKAIWLACTICGVLLMLAGVFKYLRH